MRWTIPLVFLALLGGCQCADTPKPAEPTREEAFEARQARGGDREARDGKRRQEKKAGRGRNNRVYGAPGEVSAQLVFAARGEGEAVRTGARLLLDVPGGKPQVVPLGAVPGVCEDIDKQQVEDQQALWTVRCSVGDQVGEVSVVQRENRVAVMRRDPGEEGWRAVRQVRLVGGTQLVADGPATTSTAAKEALQKARGESKRDPKERRQRDAE